MAEEIRLVEKQEGEVILTEGKDAVLLSDVRGTRFGRRQ